MDNRRLANSLSQHVPPQSPASISHFGYLLFGLLLDQPRRFAQLIHVLTQLQIFLLQLEPLVADANAVIPGCSQRALQPTHFLLAPGQFLAVAAGGR